MLQQFGYPLPLALGLIILGTLLFWRRWRVSATVSIAIAVAGLYLLATPAVSDRLVASLEHGFKPPAIDTLPAADAIVVLGGGVVPAAPPQRAPNLLHSADRILAGARLYRAGKAPLVITTGARLYADAGPSAAEAAGRILQALGVPASAIVPRSDSTSTREDALTVRRAMAGNAIERILLVTSALHMRRALATFEAAGIRAIPVPTDYMSADIAVSGEWRWLPDFPAFYLSNRAWHEYAGMVWYWMQGWI